MCTYSDSAQGAADAAMYQTFPVVRLAEFHGHSLQTTQITVR